MDEYQERDIFVREDFLTKEVVRFSNGRSGVVWTSDEGYPYIFPIHN